jgi:predicted amidophosphoribosyltransferase
MGWAAGGGQGGCVGGPTGVLATLADLLLPRTCAGCGWPGAVLCRSCSGLLAVPHLATPRRFPPGFPPTVAAGAYAGPVRPAVIAFKERGRAELAVPLGAALALAAAAVVAGLPGERRPGPVLLVPLPPSAGALRTRGRDHVGELTRRAVTELRAAGVAAGTAPLLGRRGRVRDSAGLSADQRRANLAGSFELVLPPAPGPGTPVLVLVDDVVTSGATLTEAAAALAGARLPGGPPVLAAVVAATPRPGAGTVRRSPPWPSPGGVPQRAGGRLDRLSGPRGRD